MVTLPATPTITTQPPGVTAFVRDHQLTRYSVALTDLDNDRRPEALVYAMDHGNGRGGGLCGSGGCELYVLSLKARPYRVITNISLTRPPIRVLATMAHGWRDLAVRVAGGGIVPGYEARLRFNGRTYPENPTVSPATHLGRPSGKVVIRMLPPVPRR
jgi:hypothetical protein